MKKIFRWTIGNSSNLGFEILRKSVKFAKKNFEALGFDLYICSNSNEVKVSEICQEFEIKHIVQNNENNFFKKFGGSFWKLCPPRINIDSYEIICDNDVIFKKIPEEIELFLKSNVPIICEEKIFCFGKYSKFIKNPYNSGIYGLPPGFNFEQKIIQKWKEKGSIEKLRSYKDEQGLIILCLLEFNPIKIPLDKVCYLFKFGSPVKADYEKVLEDNFESQILQNLIFERPKTKNKSIFHFIDSNKIEDHFYWNSYKTKFL